ncbi:MAG: tetratricopeptide repeat protein [Bacteroidetes bacterium]|nr:tetratricopeptide repeat protein [Bacteroidota bacterium]
MKYGLVLLLIGSLAVACGVKKNATTTEGPSKTDYAYILKFHEGIRLKTKGQTQEAITAFEQCLSLKNNDAPAYALYELYLVKNERLRAGEYLQKAYKLDQKNIHYVTELAYFTYESGNFEKSIEYFKILVKLQPRNPDFQYGLAEAYLQNGKPEEAIQALNKTQDQVGPVPELFVQKYKLYMEAKKPLLAVKELENGLKENPGDGQLLSTLVEYYYRQNQEAKAIETLERMAEAEPSNGRVQLYLAEVYKLRGDKDKYFAALTHAFEGDGVDLDQKMKVVIDLQERKMATDPRAFQLVKILAASYPTEGKPYTVLGDYYMEWQYDDSALVAYKTALSFEKSAYPIWQQVMIMEYQGGKFEDLYATSSECMQFFTTLPMVYLLKGVAANQLKKYDEAIQVMSTGIEFVVGDAPMKGEMLGQIGDAYFSKKETSEGKKSYEKALQLDPQSALLKNNYAYRLALSKVDLDKALGMMKSVNEAKPNQAHFMDTYGWVYFQKGNFESAKEWFDKALQISPEDKVIVEHSGDVLFKLGNSQEALILWKKAKVLGSKNQNLDKKIEKSQYYDPIY